MKRGAFCALMILGATALVFAKGPTTKITITGAGLQKPVDPVTGQGYVYLPGKSDQRYDLNTHSIFRGCEGNWFRANAAWQTAFRNVVHG